MWSFATLLPRQRGLVHIFATDLDNCPHWWYNLFKFTTRKKPRGFAEPEALAGLHSAIAKRTLSMVKRLGLTTAVGMAGAVAKNVGVVKAIEGEIGESLIIPSEPQIVGALGATILAMEDQPGPAN
jgi:hypothetical protein